MKKILCLFLVALLLPGCAAPVYETLGDVDHVSATLPQLRKTVLAFPDDASILTASGTDVLYTCGDFTVSLQSMRASDLAATVRSLCGYDPAQLTIMETVCGDHTRYEWVWTSAGEGGDVICRAAVLDDGNYHYCLSAFADAANAGAMAESWNTLFRSFCLES